MSAQSAIRSYRQNSVMSADPLKLILIAYDVAISGCQRQEPEKAWRAISELINALNLDAGPIALKLLAIYEYCGELIRKKQYDEAANILRDLRDTWRVLSG